MPLTGGEVRFEREHDGQVAVLTLSRPGKLNAITWEMLEALANDPLIEIGAHTVSHARISSLAPEQALAELKMYVRLLEDKLSQPVPATQVQASPRLPRPKPPPPPPRRPGGERSRASAKPRPSNGPSGPSGHGAIPSNGSSSAQAASTEGWRAW